MPASVRLKNYTLVRQLALGGMGEVWLATQDGPAGFTRPVVIKRILRSLNNDTEFVAMFLAEARLAARLTHPNIVQVIELGEATGEWFMAMEYVHGATLRDLQRLSSQRGERLPPAWVAGVASQALAGLHYAHRLTDERGDPLRLIHRDVSPDNLMVSFDGVVKLLDFGIAKAATSAGFTRPGGMRGKLSYLSPEMVRGEPLDARSDVFSMGVVLYELLCGKRPFVGDSDAAKLMQVLERTPRSPAEVESSVPAPLAAVVMRALEKSPDARFGSAEDMQSALDEALAGLKERSSPSTLAAGLRALIGEPGPLELDPAPATVTHQRPSTAPTRRRWALVPGLLGIAAAVAFGVSSMGRSTRSEGPPPVSAEAPSHVDAASPLRLPDSGATAAVDPRPARDAGEAPVSAAGLEPQPVPDAGTSLAPSKPSSASTGRVSFLVKPWAEVFLNGRSLGVTPFAPVKVPAGRVTFVLKNEALGVEKRVTVSVKREQLTEVRESLLP